MKILYIVSFAVLFSCASKTNAFAEISSFEECVKAGNPVKQSLPLLCTTPDGKTFTSGNLRVPEIEKVEKTCKDLCGDGKCQEIVCMAIGCPCAESSDTCPSDCKDPK